MANRTVANLTTVLQMNNSKFKKGLTGSQKALKGFQNKLKQVGGMIAGAFAVGAIVNFTKESVKLAAKLQGVEAAFRSLDKPDLLDDLRKATRGMVSDLELMRQAVRAENFKIPLEQLATYFEFATKRSLQTGESVDYLVNSIIDGIGRKSSLVMDNLGISASVLQEEIKKTGDFAVAAGNLIKEGIEDMGDVADTATVKIVAMQATWDNFKAKAGGKLLEMAAGQIEYIEARRYLMDSDEATFWERLWARTTGQTEAVTDLAKHYKILSGSVEEATKELNAYAGILDKTVESGIDWAATNKAIYDQWLKENKIIQAQIALKEKLLDIDTQIRQNAEDKLKDIGKGGVEKYEKKLFDNAHEAPSFDYLNQGPEFIEGEDTEQYRKAVDKAKAFTDEMNAMLSGMTAQAVSNLVGGLAEGLASGAGGLEGFFSSILDMFGKFMQQMGAMLIAYGVGMEAFKKAFSNPMAAIAAGVALVAIGGAMSGAAQRFNSSGSIGSAGNAASGNSYQNPTVNFQISGSNLVGVLDRQNYSNYMNT